MENLSDVIEAAKHLSQNQKSIIKSLSQFGVPVTISFFDSNKIVIVKLQERGLVTIQDEQVSLTLLGKSILKFWQNQANDILEPRKTSAKNEASKQERLEKSNQFLELYKQGLSYQDIGDKYGLSRERVRQVLNPNVEFRVYLREQEEAKLVAEEQKKEQAKQKLYSRSLAALYPERVAELWDYHKNGDLKPEEIIAGSTQHNIWLKCSDGHSWEKKPHQIVASWRRKLYATTSGICNSGNPF